MCFSRIIRFAQRMRKNAVTICFRVFYADDPELAKQYLDMGIDTILTNDYLTIYNAVKNRLPKRA